MGLPDAEISKGDLRGHLDFERNRKPYFKYSHYEYETWMNYEFTQQVI